MSNSGSWQTDFWTLSRIIREMGAELGFGPQTVYVMNTEMWWVNNSESAAQILASVQDASVHLGAMLSMAHHFWSNRATADQYRDLFFEIYRLWEDHWWNPGESIPGPDVLVPWILGPEGNKYLVWVAGEFFRRVRNYTNWYEGEAMAPPQEYIDVFEEEVMRTAELLGYAYHLMEIIYGLYVRHQPDGRKQGSPEPRMLCTALTMATWHAALGNPERYPTLVHAAHLLRLPRADGGLGWIDAQMEAQIQEAINLGKR